VFRAFYILCCIWNCEFRAFKIFVMLCVIVVSRSKLLSGQEVLDIMNVLDQYLITDSNENA
jgi:hypothetical protein